MSSNKSTAVYNDALEILFEDRNKDYGAYKLRRNYVKYLRRAVVLGLLFTFLFFAVPIIYAGIKEKLNGKKDKVLDLTQVDLLPPPKKVEEAPKPIPPPPPKKVEPPKVETKKFVPPKIKEDSKVKKEEEIVEQKELKEVQVSDKTQEGKKVEGNVADTGDKEDLGDAGAKKVIEPEVKKEPEIFTVVEQMPTFPGGDAEMIKYLSNNIKYPSIARDNGIEGTVVLEFIVDENGKISEIKVKRDIGGGCGAEAIRVVNQMPQWKPGKQNGRPVKVRFNLPVRFKLEG